MSEFNVNDPAADAARRQYQALAVLGEAAVEMVRCRTALATEPHDDDLWDKYLDADKKLDEAIEAYGKEMEIK